ncbi:hypothetical protein PPTG_23643 [Phytophthora nicotianae INRA-310]|uniref:Uncharacterized protein n=1 Tax=Phytophthora nicotianae (strain INRA-310) TaxID=761204 RepID=W2PVF1_PHYN3|nr:hypothetical protein PPTG_23643 [Phytophthora nicotianae INRA-310]ETN04204.1 hypothetical protein PPTG_23643 [Phytophthora nicotianae INRA-310]
MLSVILLYSSFMGGCRTMRQLINLSSCVMLVGDASLDGHCSSGFLRHPDFFPT